MINMLLVIKELHSSTKGINNANVYSVADSYMYGIHFKVTEIPNTKSVNK